MKTKKIKIFGIGAVVLMLLVAIAPVINGTQLRSSSMVNMNAKPTNSDFDIGVWVEELKFVEYHKLYGQVEYVVNFVVWWEPMGYEGTYDVELKTKTGERIDSWTIFIPFTSGPDGEFYTRKIYLDINENYEINEELKIVGNNVVLNIDPGAGGDINSSNDNAEYLATWWTTATDYTPTLGQILASAPHLYKNTTSPVRPDVYYMNMTCAFDGRILPNILLSHRLGWVGAFLLHLINFSIYIGEAVLTTAIFLNTVKTEINLVGSWIKDVLEWFGWLLIGTWVPGYLYDLIQTFLNYVFPALKTIIETAFVMLVPEMLIIFSNFYDEVNKTSDWIYSKPWFKPIIVYGDVGNVQPGEVVTVSCRDASCIAVDDDNNGVATYKLVVSSEPMYNEKSNISIHKCQVSVLGDRHSTPSVSIPILSYAFSDGSLYWLFTSPGGNEKPRTLLNSITTILKNWFKNKPVLSILEKVFGINKVDTESPSTLERDYDLDVLVQNAIAEQKQYEPYDVVYEEYYSGAPHDPYTVYYGADQVVVGFKSYVDVTKLETVELYPIVDRLAEINAVVVEIYGITPEAFMELVNKSEDVSYSELNYIYEKSMIPNDEFWEYQWGPKAINCLQAWDLEQGEMLYGDVAILDTGCNIKHIDIPDTDSYLDYNFVSNNDDVTDDCMPAHGTHCAGIICAKTNNEIGIAGIAHIMPHYGKVLDSSGVGYGFIIAKAIIHMANGNGMIHVISMSLGGYGISTAMHVACDYAYYVKNILIVAAAGNDGLLRVSVPGRFDSVLAVGAVDKNLNLCSWSNHGPDLDLVAPGEDILSTTYNPDYFTLLSGTSMACPHVAGVAALYFSANPGASASSCKGRLFATAMDLGSSGKDWTYGYGLVDALGILKGKSKPVSIGFQHLLLRMFPILQQLSKNLNQGI